MEDKKDDLDKLISMSKRNIIIGGILLFINMIVLYMFCFIELIYKS